MFVIFCFLTTLDYFTGTVAAKRKNKWTKEKAIQGIWEKFGFFILITLAFCLDYTISFIGSNMNDSFSTNKSFTLILLVWLIGTEGRSNAKNLKAWGVKVPKFLTNGFVKLQDTENKKDK
jgi:toxin secretion/phage lysis holin